MHLYCTFSIKKKILSMLGTGYFLKIAKINSQQENPLCPNRKNQFPQNTKKSPILKNKLPQKFRATQYLLISRKPSIENGRLCAVPIFPQGQQSERNASVRKAHPGETRVPFSCRVIFTRARVSLALLSLRKNGEYSQSTNGTPFTYLGYKSKNFASLLTVVNALSSNFKQTEMTDYLVF